MNILAVIYKVGGYFKGKLTKENYYSIAWAFSRACIAGVAAMVFIICSINMNSYFGILGSVLTMLSTTLYTHANSAIVDVPMAFFVTLFFLILTILYSKSDWRFKYIILLAFIAGIAIAMKYTAALLIPVLIFVSVEYVHKKRTLILSIKQIKKVLVVLGISLLMVSAIAKINQKTLLAYFTGLTTDGILEIEYIRTLSNFSSFIMIIGILLIIFSLWNKLIQSEWVGFLISPFHLFTIFIVIIGFAIFSPFTLIEFKKSFANFMYEYRHMNIGSAAVYHHLSEEYKTIIANLSSTDSGIFYINLIYHNLGIIGIIFLFYGIYHIYLQKSAYSITIMIYLVLLLFTLFTWQNVAVRYTLSIFPIMIVFIMHGLFTVFQIIIQKYSFNKYLVAIILYMIVLIHPIANFIN
jgi:4-amino-4-deoxy-L-arabinose transferase-like glycosyltransferase